MKVVIIDGQGGRLGQKLAEAIKASPVECGLYAVGTNTIATSAMLKGGADFAATGENAVIVACRDADVIVGPIGITVADALLGEITPEMAKAVGQSRAVKLFLPVSHCNNQVVGVQNLSLSDMVEAAVEKLKDCVKC
ncbi:MAG: DUF3842 family protein [Lachnospiraceae bacterium]|nr:DUF3842 family protein [Lachnospiraceae bacterium]MBO7633801.1 DUF3842 family protein [Lachnospiraceae bacterium]MBP5652461.1 DUF3842 family protein [Lachnospiraceae bacterium]